MLSEHCFVLLLVILSIQPSTSQECNWHTTCSNESIVAVESSQVVLAFSVSVNDDLGACNKRQTLIMIKVDFCLETCEMNRYNLYVPNPQQETSLYYQKLSSD